MACACPPIEPVLHLPDDARKVRERPLTGLKHVNSLNRVPQSDFVFEVDPVSLAVAFDEYAHQAEQKLLVLPGRFE